MLEGIAGVMIGLMVGATAVWLWLDSKVGSPDSVETLKRENAQFREEVNEHFVQTAELINQLTDSYKAVFDHLSEGAERLVDEQVIRERMPQVSAEEIRLKRLGAPLAATRVDAEAPAAAEEEPTVAEAEPEPAPEEPTASQAEEEKKHQEQDQGQDQEQSSATSEEAGDTQDAAETPREETNTART